MAAEDREPEPGLTTSAAAPIEPAGASPQAAPPAAREAFDEPTLAELLWSEPYRFEFFAALRVLARMAEADRVSLDDPGSLFDRLRFRAHQSLSFPPSEIWDIVRPAADGRLADMTVAFIGLTGPMGALPRPYSELVMQRIRKRDLVLRDFLDLFNHRLVTIFAQAGEKYRFYLTHESAETRERWREAQGLQKLRGFLLDERSKIDLFSQVLLDLGGMGTSLLRYKDTIREVPFPRMELRDGTHQFFSGHLAQSHHSSVSLARMLSEFFGLTAEVIPFIGQWVLLPVEYQTCLRRRDLASLAAPQARSSETCADPRLGQNTVVGSRIWEVQGRFRIRLGPLTFDQFRHFLPVGAKYRRLAHLTRLYVGATFDFDVQPVLLGSEVPWCQFGATGSRAPRLGWNTWLRNRAFTDNVDDAIFGVPDHMSMED